MCSRIDYESRNTGRIVAIAGAILVISLLDPAMLGRADPTHMPTVVGVGVDKWLHASGYAVLGGALASTWPRPTRVALGLSVVLAVGFGAGIEMLQLFLPSRTASVADFVANAAGAVLGVIAWYWFRR